MATLPVLDVTPWRADPASVAASRFADALRDACHGPGFCYLTGHGVDASVESAVIAAVGRFFALPEERRLEIANVNSPHFRGYTRVGTEHTGGRPDWRDQLDLGPERPALDLGPADPPYLRVRGPNQWPTAVAELRPAATAWMAAMTALGDSILSAIAQGLGQPRHWFEEFTAGEPDSMAKLIRYPAGPIEPSGADGDTAADADPLGVGLHQDSGLITFILQNDVGGLQVLVDDELIDAEPVIGTYVLNLGELLARVSGGYLRATRHRVVRPPGTDDRLALAFFHNPSMAARLRPVDLPHDLAVAAGGDPADPDDPVFDTYGQNWLKFRLRSHPDVAARHYPDLVEAN